MRVTGQKTREEIKVLIADGWRFRKKRKKDTIYISARRKGKENGLGAFSPEYWAMIEEATKSPDSTFSVSETTQTKGGYEAAEDPMLKTWEAIIQRMRFAAFMRCLHVKDDGFCDYWRLENLPVQAAKLRENEFKSLFKVGTGDAEKVRFWFLKPDPNICSNCHAYVDEVTPDFVNSHREYTAKRNKKNYISFNRSKIGN
jgi:hypothetical protein